MNGYRFPFPFVLPVTLFSLFVPFPNHADLGALTLGSSAFPKVFGLI
jgi:hypothetical protein